MADETWICPTCAQSISSKFCPTCGEARPDPHSLTLGAILEQAFEAVSHADGRLWSSFGALIARPGALTAAYQAGRRKPYLGPFQIFLVANLLFILVQALVHGHVFASTLDSQLHRQIYSPLAQRLYEQRMAALHQPIAFTTAFNQAAEFNAKSLIILMTPPFAVLTSILFLTAKRPFGVHMVFALHFFSFLLLQTCVLLLIGLVLSLASTPLSAGTREVVIANLQLLISVIYLYLAARRTFAGHWLGRIAGVLAMGVAAGAIWIGYRFLIFAVTLYTTSG